MRNTKYWAPTPRRRPTPRPRLQACKRRWRQEEFVREVRSSPSAYLGQLFNEFLGFRPGLTPTFFGRANGGGTYHLAMRLFAVIALAGCADNYLQRNLSYRLPSGC